MQDGGAMTDNGREEQWRKEMRLLGQDNETWKAVMTIGGQPALLADESVIDAILAARAQAGLAQRLAEVGQRLHDWIDDHNPEGTEVVCNVCHAEGYDGNGLIHRDDCALQQWRVLAAGPTAELCNAHLYTDEVLSGPRCGLPKGHPGFCEEVTAGPTAAAE